MGIVFNIIYIGHVLTLENGRHTVVDGLLDDVLVIGFGDLAIPASDAGDGLNDVFGTDVDIQIAPFPCSAYACNVVRTRAR